MRSLREKLEISQAKLAELANTSQPQIKRLEAGERELTKTWAERIAPHLGVTAEYLLFPEGKQADAPVEIPVISWVAASSFLDAPDVERDDEAPKIRMLGMKPSDYVALRVSGDSMNRIAPEGSIAIVDLKDRELFAKRYYVFQHETEGATFKRYMRRPDRLDPSSTNPDWQPIEMGPGIGVIGRVVKVIVDL